jgi:hypothetical protein
MEDKLKAKMQIKYIFLGDSETTQQRFSTRLDTINKGE